MVLNPETGRLACRLPVCNGGTPCRRETRARLSVFFVLLFLAVSSEAHAQLTRELLLHGAVEDPGDEKFKDLDGAIARFVQGDVAGARKSLDASADKHAELAPADVLLAKLWFAVGRNPEGRAALENSVAKTPSDPEAYLLLGNLAASEGRLTEAFLLFIAVRKRCADSDDSDLRNSSMIIGSQRGLAAVAMGRSDWTTAEKAIRNWVKFAPKSADALTQLGQVLFYQRRFSDAYEAMKQAYQLDPASPRPEINMALLYEELVALGDVAKHKNARNAMQSAAKEDPDNLVTRLAIARWALETCEVDMALANATAALKIDAQSFEAKLLLALAARHKKDFVIAERVLLEAHAQAPADFVAISQLVLVLAAQDDAAKLRLALEYAQLNARANSEIEQPGGREAAVALGWVMLRVGQTQAAAAQVQAAVNAGPLSDEGAHFAAHVLAKTGEPDVARQLLSPVMKHKRCFPSRKDAEALFAKLSQSGE